MQRYSRSQKAEGAAADPVGDWYGTGGETGLEEPMWHLGLRSGPESYLVRPEEADCTYYLRTGFCGYGARCRFNHPRDRGAAVGAMRASGQEHPERVGQPVCQYYMRTGMCKFGASCKYDHPRQGGRSPASVRLNIYGYPLRLGEKECSYYVKTGQCKFGATCKFHHPQPAGAQVLEVAHGPGPLKTPAAVPGPVIYPAVQSPSVQPSQQYGVVAGNWPVAQPALVPGSYISGTYGSVLLPPGMMSVPGWTSYPAPFNLAVSSSMQPAVGANPVYGVTQLSPSPPGYTGQYPSVASSASPSSSGQKELIFPKRPGQPECHYFMKTGDCKFGASCKYHHPPEWSGSQTNIVLSPMGLPLRPGAPVCSHYAQNRVCRFGPSCKFDHPMRSLSYSTSASSLTDIPVAPYPVGPSVGALAPSLSSSDLRPHLSSGSAKDALSTGVSSVTTSSGTVGSMLSKSGHLPPCSAQHYGQSATPSSNSSNMVQGDDGSHNKLNK